MKKIAWLAAFTALIASPVLAQGTLNVKIMGVANNSVIPPLLAFCMPSDKGGVKDGGNLSPGIQWSGAPDGTQSYAILVVDKDVPATFELANQNDKIIPEDFPRKDFYHWVLVDIPSDINAIVSGRDSKKIIQGGKPLGKTPYGINGQNDYATFNKGTWGGYDGPCPPWNDERLHHYHFIVYALDVKSLGLSGVFNGKQAEDAMKDHILARGEVVGTYTNRK